MLDPGLEYVLCDLCGQDDTVHLFTASDYVTGERFPVVRCNQCGLVYTNPRPTQEAVPRYYPTEYHSGRSDPLRRRVEGLIRQVRYWRNREVLRWLPADRSGRVLDIGCGRGWQLHDLQARGVEVVGTELSEDAARFARQDLGLDVRTGLLETCGFAPESFDLVMAWHSLEHLSSPRRTLTEAHRLLRKDGYLLVVVPNFSSLQACIAGRHWFHLDVPRHLYHFSEDTLVRLLADAGFQVVSTDFCAPALDACGLAQSLLNLSGLAPNFLYGLVRYRAGPAKSMRLPRLMWNLAANLVLLPAAAAIGVVGTVLGVWLGQGASLQVVAIPKLIRTPAMAGQRPSM